jgi:hypothetical protein
LNKRDEATLAHARVYHGIFLWEMKYSGSRAVVRVVSNLAVDMLTPEGSSPYVLNPTWRPRYPGISRRDHTT